VTAVPAEYRGNRQTVILELLFESKGGNEAGSIRGGGYSLHANGNR